MFTLTIFIWNQSQNVELQCVRIWGTWANTAQGWERRRKTKGGLDSVCVPLSHTLMLLTSHTGSSLPAFKNRKEGGCSSFITDSLTWSKQQILRLHVCDSFSTGRCPCICTIQGMFNIGEKIVLWWGPLKQYPEAKIRESLCLAKVNRNEQFPSP